ncbi:hypothetical protein PG994_007913 [Apiospora phragmitis]|uniref:Dolichyl-diphosphooligosaccharide-protein glycosyltransferase subunit OST5 n=1 Tax=Apiospora phragmitis TaxID=2905665 RepID=A0ABR1URI8_9PEZI
MKASGSGVGLLGCASWFATRLQGEHADTTSLSNGLSAPLVTAAIRLSTFMDSQLREIWATAPGTPFLPTVGKGTQFTVGFSLLLFGVALFGGFALSMPTLSPSIAVCVALQLLTCTDLDRSFINIPLLGVPASVALAVGTVYMFCAVGVYV